MIEFTFSGEPNEIAELLRHFGVQVNEAGKLAPVTEPSRTRMRTALQAFEQLRAEDPESRISLGFIREIIATRAIPVTEIGKKKLIDYDTLLEFLKNPVMPEEPKPSAPTFDTSVKQTGKVRKIMV